ncbi:MAG: hypothetical protein LBH81_02165 [Rickettsiales bacterium]|nr:hypothetical protein [Rickettsiales bacterium]
MKKNDKEFRALFGDLFDGPKTVGDIIKCLGFFGAMILCGFAYCNSDNQESAEQARTDSIIKSSSSNAR